MVQDGVDAVDGLQGPVALAIAPDNRQLLVASTTEGAITSFNRDLTEGTLTYFETVKTPESGSPSLAGASDLFFDPRRDGVWVATSSGSSLVFFDRDLSTGALTNPSSITSNQAPSTAGLRRLASPGGQSGLFAITADTETIGYHPHPSPLAGSLTYVSETNGQTDAGETYGSLFSVESIWISNDSRFLYTTPVTRNMILSFSIDAETGVLSYSSKVEDDARYALNNANVVLGSPDQRHLYVGARGDDAITTFMRHQQTGHLLRMGTVTGIGNPSGMAISPDGRHLYVSDGDAQNVMIFDRSLGNGSLTVNSTIALSYPKKIKMSPDGRLVYIDRTTRVTVMSRDPSTGNLTEIQTLSDVYGITEIQVSSDSKWLFVSSSTTSTALRVYSRDFSNNQLTLSATYTNGTNGFSLLGSTYGLALNFDLGWLAASAYDNHSVTLASVNASTGAISATSSMTQKTDVELASDPTAKPNHLKGAYTTIFSPDMRTLYVYGDKASSSTDPSRYINSFQVD